MSIQGSPLDLSDDPSRAPHGGASCRLDRGRTPVPGEIRPGSRLGSLPGPGEDAPARQCSPVDDDLLQPGLPGFRADCLFPPGGRGRDPQEADPARTDDLPVSPAAAGEPRDDILEPKDLFLQPDRGLA